MANYDQELRLFQELRLHPWVPENKIIIDAWIARLSVEDPSAAQNFKQQYADKMAAYEASQPVVEEAPVEEPAVPTVEPVPEPVEVEEPIVPAEPVAVEVQPVEVPVVEPAPKKKSHKKSSPTL